MFTLNPGHSPVNQLHKLFTLSSTTLISCTAKLCKSEAKEHVYGFRTLETFLLCRNKLICYVCCVECGSRSPSAVVKWVIHPQQLRGYVKLPLPGSQPQGYNDFNQLNILGPIEAHQLGQDVKKATLSRRIIIIIILSLLFKKKVVFHLEESRRNCNSHEI